MFGLKEIRRRIRRIENHFDPESGNLWERVRELEKQVSDLEKVVGKQGLKDVTISSARVDSWGSMYTYQKVLEEAIDIPLLEKELNLLLEYLGLEIQHVKEREYWELVKKEDGDA